MFYNLCTIQGNTYTRMYVDRINFQFQVFHKIYFLFFVYFCCCYFCLIVRSLDVFHSKIELNFKPIINSQFVYIEVGVLSYIYLYHTYIYILFTFCMLYSERDAPRNHPKLCTFTLNILRIKICSSYKREKLPYIYIHTVIQYRHNTSIDGYICLHSKYWFHVL